MQRLLKRWSFVAAAAGFAAFSGTASAAILSWDFTVHPTQEAVPMTGYASGPVWDGSTTGQTPYGEAIPGTGLQGDGTAIFADSPAESSNSGFAIGGVGAFTVDMRVKVLENVAGGDGRGKSISFREASGNGRGMAFDTGALRLVDGGGTVRTYALTGSFALTDWQIIRNSLSGNNTVDTYIWDLANSNWIFLGNQGLGGSGSASEIPPAGFAIGSLAGSSTNSGKFQIDWAAADSVNALGGSGDPLGSPIPEPATLGMLVLGCIPMVMRRRRAA